MNKNTSNMNLEDWQRYKSGAYGKEYEKTLSQDELNYLSEKGFEKANINSKDVNELMKRIDAKTFSAANMNAVFIGGIIVVAFVTLFFFISGHNKENIPAKTKTGFTSIQTVAHPETTNSLTQAETNNDSSDFKKHGPWHKEHFAIKNQEQPFQKKETFPEKENIDMNVNTINSIPVEDKTEINFEQLPNASVIYISGLKITNFQIYYFHKNQKFELVNGGIDPQYDNINSYKTTRKELKEGDKTTADAVIREAAEYFSKQNYPATLEDMDLLLKINKEDVNALFYSAMSFYFLQKNQKAIEYFDKVLESPNNIFHQEAEFYKANALLRANQGEQAYELLKKIIEAKGFYADRAAQLLVK